MCSVGLLLTESVYESLPGGLPTGELARASLPTLGYFSSIVTGGGVGGGGGGGLEGRDCARGCAGEGVSHEASALSVHGVLGRGQEGGGEGAPLMCAASLC